MININIMNSNRCNGDTSLYINFDYNSDIVSKIKSLPTRYYDMNNKTWEVPFDKLGVVLAELSDYEITITGKYVDLHKDDFEMPNNFEFKTKPFEHQLDGFKFGMTHNNWLLGDEQGLGKTKQVIDIAVAKKLTEGTKHCLIVCCVNSLKWNWQNEVSIHSNESAWILGQRSKRGKITIGSNAERLEDLNDIDNLPYFIITNIETLRYHVKTGNKIAKRVNGKTRMVDEVVFPITDKLKELCESGEISLVAVDEYHKCKNPDAEQAKQILQVNGKYNIAMTGTPLMNKPLDLYMPLKWLGYEKHSFYSFRNHHCILGGYGGHEVIGYKHLDELSETLDTVMLRRLKDDVLDLPEKLLINDYIEMLPDQAKLYSEISQDIMDNIDKIKMVNNPLAELIRLRQVTGAPSILSSTIKTSAKLIRMMEIVDDAIENGEKVVIFSNWTQMTDEAYKLLSASYSGVVITGNTKDNERQGFVERFQNDKNCKFILGTIGAMGTGLTLTAGTVEIFLDEPWNMALKNQAIDRCHRIGAKSTVTVYTLICKNTIDERINEIVEKKGAISDILVDNAESGDKTALINYLLS